MEIRLINESDDRNAISHVYEESWKAAYKGIVPQSYLESIESGRWAKALDNPEWHSLIMLDGDRIVGTSAYCASRFEDMKDFGEIISIYFLPEYFGRGYGKKLLQAAINGLSQMGYTDIFLWVLEDNIRARRFYEHYGFVASGKYMENNIGGKVLRELQYIFHVM